MSSDFLPLKGIDHVEFFVGSAMQTAYFLKHAFGFKIKACGSLETDIDNKFGFRNKLSYYLEQNKVRFIITSSYYPDTDVMRHYQLHGDGIKTISLEVDDAAKSFQETIKRGASPAMLPTMLEDEYGHVIISAIHTYGDTIHKFVERKNYHGVFMPGFIEFKDDIEVTPVGLKYIDHIVGNVELGRMNDWVKFYQEVMGFKIIFTADDKDVSTEYSALMSKVVSNGTGYIKFPINEPATGKKKSQIQEYLDYYKTPGAQHIAIATDNIFATIRELSKRGVRFISEDMSKQKYYGEDLKQRIKKWEKETHKKVDENWEELIDLGVLVDLDDEGYLLQLFTKQMCDRPTYFFEIIQRKGAKSFGKNNFRALFEAIQVAQKRRGNL